MSDFFTTTAIAIVVFIFLGLGLSIGYLISGRAIKRGTCGYDPTKKEGCNENKKDCPLCGSEEEIEQTKKEEK